MKKAAGLIALILLCLASAPRASAEERAVETSIEAIFKDPKKFHRHIVRIRGVLDECGRFSCSLCANAAGELPAEKAQCLRPEFEESLGGVRLDSLYRFAEITVEGWYDYSCDAVEEAAKDLGHEDSRSGIEHVIVCTDRATDLRVTRITAVHKRWPATQGPFHDYLGGVLAQAGPDLAHRIAQLHDLFQPEGSTLRIGGKVTGSRYTVLTRTDSDASDNPTAYLCICDEADCAGQWPTHTGHVWLPSLADPYRCTAVQRVKGEWRFPPAFE